MSTRTRSLLTRVRKATRFALAFVPRSAVVRKRAGLGESASPGSRTRISSATSTVPVTARPPAGPIAGAACRRRSTATGDPRSDGRVHGRPRPRPAGDIGKSRNDVVRGMKGWMPCLGSETTFTATGTLDDARGEARQSASTAFRSPAAVSRRVLPATAMAWAAVPRSGRTPVAPRRESVPGSEGANPDAGGAAA